MGGSQGVLRKGYFKKKGVASPESVAEKSGWSLALWGGGGQEPGVHPPGLTEAILGGVQAGIAASSSALGQACSPGRQMANLC